MGNITVIGFDRRRTNVSAVRLAWGNGELGAMIANYGGGRIIHGCLLMATLLASMAYTVYPAFVTRDTWDGGKHDVYARSETQSAWSAKHTRHMTAQVRELSEDIDRGIN